MNKKTLSEMLEEYSFERDVIVKKETNHGVLAFYNPHQRDEFVYPAIDLEKVADKVKAGWAYRATKKAYILRAPEVWLCDLSDPFKANATGDLIENLALYLYINDLVTRNKFNQLLDYIIKKDGYNDFEAFLLKGPSLETEFRLAGSDSRIKNFKSGVHKELKLQEEWRGYIKTAKTICPYQRKLKIRAYSTDALSKEAKDFYDKIKSIHKVVTPFYSITEVFNGIWSDFPKSDVYIFVPKSGFKIALGFVDSVKRYDNIMFWEYHAGKQISQENKIFSKELKDKTVSIIDVSYSGATLSYLKEAVLQEGGYPLTMALFPKSRLAVHASDYVLFLDRLIKSDSIEPNNKWGIMLYKNIIGEKNV